MARLFLMGGPVFMGILTVLFLILVIVTIVFILKVSSGKSELNPDFIRQLSYIKSLGLFAMITGILGQLIGLVMAFSAIERVGDISPQIVFGGLKVSMISTLYGISIFILSLLFWFLLDLYHHKKLKI